MRPKPRCSSKPRTCFIRHGEPGLAPAAPLGRALPADCDCDRDPRPTFRAASRTLAAAAKLNGGSTSLHCAAAPPCEERRRAGCQWCLSGRCGASPSAFLSAASSLCRLLTFSISSRSISPSVAVWSSDRSGATWPERRRMPARAERQQANSRASRATPPQM